MTNATQELYEQNASDAIDWIDGLPKVIQMLLLKASYDFNLVITKEATGEAMAIIEEALSDLLHKDRCRKVAICGEPIDIASSVPYGTTRLITPSNTSMRGFSPLRQALSVTREDVKP